MTVKKLFFYPVQEGEVPTYYANATSVISAKLADKYGISAADVALLSSYNQQIPLVIAKAHNDRKVAQASTKSKNEVLANAETDLKRIVNNMLSLPNFDEADAELMGIRRQAAALDLNTVKPTITNITVLPDQVIIDWTKGRMHGVVIELSYDGSDWEKLDKDTRSPYEDTRKNKAAKQAETRHYRLRYLYSDQLVGQYSDVVKAEVAIY